MGRPAKVSVGKFRQAHRTSSSVQEVSEKLGISVPTVYSWIKRLNLENFTRKTKRTIEEHRQIVSLFSGNMSLIKFQIAAKMKSHQAARGQLYNSIAQVWVHDSPSVPLPEKLIEIRVANHLYDFVNSKKRGRQFNDSLSKIIRAITDGQELSAIKTRQVREYLERVRQQ